MLSIVILFFYTYIKVYTESIKKYSQAILSSLVIFALLSFYLYLRRGYFDLFIANKVFAATSLIILAVVLLIGNLGRLYDLFDPLLIYRKHLGIVSFFAAFVHGVLSLFFLSSRFSIDYYLYNLPTFILGLVGLVILGYLFLISFKKIIQKMNPKVWWLHQVWGARIAGGLVFLHLILMKYPGWIRWYQIGGSDDLVRPYLPPASILAAAFGLFVILARVVEIANRNLAKRIIPIIFVALILFIGLSFTVGMIKSPMALRAIPSVVLVSMDDQLQGLTE